MISAGGVLHTKKNPEGVEMQLAQDGAKPGPPIRASFARIGVGSGVLGKVGKRTESRRDGTGSHADTEVVPDTKHLVAARFEAVPRYPAPGCGTIDRPLRESLLQWFVTGHDFSRAAKLFIFVPESASADDRKLAQGVFRPPAKAGSGMRENELRRWPEGQLRAGSEGQLYRCN